MRFQFSSKRCQRWSSRHRCSQDFLWGREGCTFLHQKSDDLFVITLSYIVICVIYYHQLPFYVICGGAPHQIQPYFTSFQQKCLKKFFRRPGGAPEPLHLPGYAYGSRCNANPYSNCPNDLPFPFFLFLWGGCERRGWYDNHSQSWGLVQTWPNARIPIMYANLAYSLWSKWCATLPNAGVYSIGGVL